MCLTYGCWTVVIVVLQISDFHTSATLSRTTPTLVLESIHLQLLYAVDNFIKKVRSLVPLLPTKLSTCGSLTYSSSTLNKCTWAKDTIPTRALSNKSSLSRNGSNCAYSRDARATFSSPAWLWRRGPYRGITLLTSRYTGIHSTLWYWYAWRNVVLSGFAIRQTS